MSCPEIHPAVDANNVQARRNAEAFSEATQRAVAEATAFADVLKHRRTRKATLAMLYRVTVAFLSIVIIKILNTFGHMSAEVSITGILLLVCWLGIWVGAWLQFMWGKEGLLR